MRKLLVTLDNGKTGTFEVPTELSQEEAWDQIAADIPKGTAIANIRQISGATETPASNDVSPALKLRREMLSQYYGGDLDQLASKYNNMDTRKALLDKVGDLSKKQQIIGLMDVYNGVSPSDENSSTNQYFNEFNSMLGKEIDYRLENKQGITAGNVVFPELSRRIGTDGSTLSKVLGGIKDVVTLPARAGRSAIEELMPLSGQYTYAERMAMPEKYKTGIQQMGDEMLSFSNLPNMAAGKAVNLASRAPVIGSKVGKIANMGLKPADLVFGNTPSFASSLGRSIAKDAPSIGADIGYELTKPADETGGGVNAGMIALGSLFGHALPVAAKSKLGTPQSTMEWLAPQSYLKSQLEPFKTPAYIDRKSVV